MFQKFEFFSIVKILWHNSWYHEVTKLKVTKMADFSIPNNKNNQKRQIFAQKTRRHFQFFKFRTFPLQKYKFFQFSKHYKLTWRENSNS